MSADGYRHIHHIISAKPLPLLNPNETNHAIHYTQTINDGNEVVNLGFSMKPIQYDLLFL